MSESVEPSVAEVLAKQIESMKAPKRGVHAVYADPFESLDKAEEPQSLSKSITNLLNGGAGKPNTVERLAFERDPTRAHDYAALYYPKLTLVPDQLLKRIAIQDSLVAAVINTRSGHMSAFGREQSDRFSTGFKIEPRRGVMEGASKEDIEAMADRIDVVTRTLLTCGQVSGWDVDDQINLAQMLKMLVRDGVTVGRFAVEVVYAETLDGKKRFHSLRPTDAATIFRAKPHSTQAESVRREALHMLEAIKNDKLEPERFQNDEYNWVQVIDSKPVQAFTSQEMLVHNLYPVTDIELGGYPVTPLDTIISEVTTHINITQHNKLYFQNGRAARGMLVIKSDDIDASVVSQVRQTFQASINSVSNSFRLPIFGINKEDEIVWSPIESSGGRDMEFQYLSDQNARTIMAAFQMSPEELPGYSHLCLHPDTKIWTETGIVSIGDLLGDEQEVDGFRVWTGTKWENARAFVTGDRSVRRTTTSSGITLVTSPDHLFRVVDENGQLAWRKQEDLTLGDHVLVNRKPVPGSEANIPSYNGRKLTPDMMEVLGWLTGDGTVTVRKRGKVRHSKELEFYYHQDRELDLRARHVGFMEDFGLAPKPRDRRISQRAVDRQKKVYGFKSVASIRTSTSLYDSDFVQWLLSLGFTSSSEGKSIPGFIHGLPEEYRSRFLLGLFSADGSKDKLDTPTISISDERMREETKGLLSSLGLRTKYCEGTHKTNIRKSDDGSFVSEYVKEASRLVIKDKDLFYERVGFLQDHKQPSSDFSDSDKRWDRVPKSVAVWLADEILRTTLAGADHETRDKVRHSLKDNKNLNRNRSLVVRHAEEYGIELPEWFHDYSFEQVEVLENEDQEIEMVDIEVFDELHAFAAQGVIVHNSRGSNAQSLSESNNEWKLHSARDVGIRPLMANIQDFFNERILPLIDPEVARLCYLEFKGLDADTPEKETARLQQSGTLYMTMNDIMEKVEKDPYEKFTGGDFPLNPSFQAIIKNYMTFGQIKEHFFGVEGASKDESLAFYENPMWFQWVHLQMQMEQMKQQQQMMEQQAQAQGGEPQGQPQEQPSPEEGGGDLASGIDQLIQTLSKAEGEKLPLNGKKLLAQHRLTVKHIMDQFEKESQATLAQIVTEVGKHVSE